VDEDDEEIRKLEEEYDKDDEKEELDIEDNDDDEPILPASGRRVGVGATPVGQSWGTPGETTKGMEPLGARQFGPPGWGFPPPPTSNLWGPGPFGGVPPQPPNGSFNVPSHYPSRSPSTPSQSN